METEEVIKLVDGIYKVSPSQLLSFLQSGLRMGSKDGTEDSLDEIGEILCCPRTTGGNRYLQHL